MSRKRAEKVRIEPTMIRRTESGVILSQNILDEYIAQLRGQGRREDSVRGYEKTLRQFFDFLPPDKLLQRDSLEIWRDQLLREGYAVRTVNSKVSLINGLLESMDCREFQVSGQLKAEEYRAPELTRQEYVRMLQTAKVLDDQRGYLLTKLFATTGLAVLDLPKVTVETVKSGNVQIRSGASVRLLYFPECLKEDLLRYARTKGRYSGMLFTKRNGEPLERTQVSLYIRQLAQEARVPVEKGNIRCLRQLYKNTISGIEANFDLLVQQAYARQLELEQLSVRWEM